MKKRQRIKGIACMLLLVILVNTVGIIPVQAVDDDDEASDYSFYTLASVASTALSTMAADTKNDDTLQDKFGNGLNPSSAGGLLGYPDDTKARGVEGMFASVISTSSVSYNYKQLCSGSYKEIETDGEMNLFSVYCALGASLADMGIDHTASDKDFEMMRSVTGAVIRLFYEAAHIVMVLFAFVLKFLKTINPFQFFSHANKYLKGIDDTAVNHETLVVNDGLVNKNFLMPIIESVSQLYASLYGMGLMVITIFFGVMVLGIVMNKVLNTESRFQTIKKFLFRASFIIFGMPLLGGSYTVILDKMENDFSSENSPAAKVIASTFCDFEGWVMDANMVVPEDIEVTVSRGSVIAKNTYSVQSFCYAINCKANNELSGFADKLKTDTVKDIITDVQNTKEKPSKDVHTWVTDMLDRYKDGKKIYASSYEQKWIAGNWTARTITQKKNLQQYIENMSSVEKMKSNSNLNQYWSKKTMDGAQNPFGIEDTSDGVIDINAYFKAGEGTVCKGYKMSPMAIYNYLNSTFTSTGIKVYSSEKASSMLVRDYHYSVNVVGKGMSSIVMLLTCMSLLASYAVLGFVYGFNIMFANIKKGMQLIAAVPGAMLGSLQSIAKVITYTVVMILEVVAHILLYFLTTEFMYTMAVVVLDEFNREATRLLSSIADVSWLMSVISGLLVTGFLIVFCMQSIKMRGPIMKAFEEMADNVIRKFVVGTSTTTTSGTTSLGTNAMSALTGRRSATGASTGLGKSTLGKGSKIQSAIQTLTTGTLSDGGQTLANGVLSDGGQMLANGVLSDGGQALINGVLSDGGQALANSVLSDGGQTLASGELSDTGQPSAGGEMQTQSQSVAGLRGMRKQERDERKLAGRQIVEGSDSYLANRTNGGQSIQNTAAEPTSGTGNASDSKGGSMTQTQQIIDTVVQNHQVQVQQGGVSYTGNVSGLNIAPTINGTTQTQTVQDLVRQNHIVNRQQGSTTYTGNTAGVPIAPAINGTHQTQIVNDVVTQEHRVQRKKHVIDDNTIRNP